MTWVLIRALLIKWSSHHRVVNSDIGWTVTTGRPNIWGCFHTFCDMVRMPMTMCNFHQCLLSLLWCNLHLFLCADDTYKIQKYVTQFENYWWNHASGQEQKGKLKNAETKPWITKSVHLTSKKWEVMIFETFLSTVRLTAGTRKQMKTAIQ